MKIIIAIFGFLFYLIGFSATATIVHTIKDGEQERQERQERIDYFYIGASFNYKEAFYSGLPTEGTNDNLQQVADGRSCDPEQGRPHSFVMAYRSRVMIESGVIALSIQNPNTHFYIYAVEATGPWHNLRDSLIETYSSEEYYNNPFVGQLINDTQNSGAWIHSGLIYPQRIMSATLVLNGQITTITHENPNFSQSSSVSNAVPYYPQDRSWDGPEFIRYLRINSRLVAACMALQYCFTGRSHMLSKSLHAKSTLTKQNTCAHLKFERFSMSQLHAYKIFPVLFDIDK